MKRYTVVVNGMTTTLRLSDQDALALGLVPDEVPAKAAKPVAHKARTPRNKQA